MCHIYSHSGIFSPSLYIVYVSHMLTLRYFLPSTLCSTCVTYTHTQVFSPSTSCSGCVTHIYSHSGIFSPPLYVVNVSHILTLRYFLPPLYVVVVSHILTLRYFLPSTLCSGCVTYTQTQVFSLLHFT